VSDALDSLKAAAEAAAAASKALADAAEGLAAAEKVAPAAPAVAPETAEAVADVVGHSVGAAVGIDPFVFRLAIFVLAIFVGYYVVWSVTPALHTPLMAVTNAISSVIVVGALIAVGVDLSQGASAVSRNFGFLALILASVNIFGGFLVTERMLAMYKKKG
jgi:NAD(P) transhydrogenase subunit alpha